MRPSYVEYGLRWYSTPWDLEIPTEWFIDGTYSLSQVLNVPRNGGIPHFHVCEYLKKIRVFVGDHRFSCSLVKSAGSILMFCLQIILCQPTGFQLYAQSI